MKKIYIAGKMTGLPDFGRERFNIIEKKLVDDGWIVLNPAILPIGLSDHNYMSICTAMLMSCDAIYMLDNWKESEGAVAEYSLAAKLCLDVFYEESERIPLNNPPKFTNQENVNYLSIVVECGRVAFAVWVNNNPFEIKGDSVLWSVNNYSNIKQLADYYSHDKLGECAEELKFKLKLKLCDHLDFNLIISCDDSIFANRLVDELKMAGLSINDAVQMKINSPLPEGELLSVVNKSRYSNYKSMLIASMFSCERSFAVQFSGFVAGADFIESIKPEVTEDGKIFYPFAEIAGKSGLELDFLLQFLSAALIRPYVVGDDNDINKCCVTYMPSIIENIHCN